MFLTLLEPDLVPKSKTALMFYMSIFINILLSGTKLPLKIPIIVPTIAKYYFQVFHGLAMSQIVEG